MQFQYSEMQQYYLLVNSKIAYVPSGRLTFLKKFSSNSLVCWQFRWSNASPASTSKRVISPAHQRLFKTIPIRQTVYSNVDILRNTTKIWSNKMRTQCSCWMRKELRNPFACEADHESQMCYWVGHILGQVPHCMEQNSSQMPGVCPVGGGQFWNWPVHYFNSLITER